MHLIIVTLVAPAVLARQFLNRPELLAVLWGATNPGAPLEHISSVIGAGHVRLGFFMATPSREDGALLAHAICRRALDAESLLTDWSISQIATASSLGFSGEGIDMN